jgi:hypothetical protein
MASLNQPNGKSPNFIAPSVPTLKREQISPLMPNTDFHIPSLALKVTSPGHAYLDVYETGRSRPNAAPNAGGARPTYSPAALLNPKGFHRSQQKDDRNVNMPIIQNSRTPNIAFQFDSPAGSSTPTQHGHPSPRNGYGHSQMYQGSQAPGVSMGHFLERMHNVSEREFPQQKRRKIERDDTEDNERKAQFSGGGKGGVLGEYMREKKEEGRKETAANGTRPSVDLTGGRLLCFKASERDG